MDTTHEHKSLLQIGTDFSSAEDNKSQNGLSTEEVHQPKNWAHWVVHLLSNGEGCHPYGEIQRPVGTV